MSTVTMTGVCQGCGVEIPPSTRRPRKWCSPRCRKSQYDRECIDCGERTSGTGPGDSKGRCRSCANKIPRQADLAKRVAIETLWAEGYTAREIAERLHMHSLNIGSYRARGYNLPHRRTPEQLERILKGTNERMAKARAARKAT